MTYKDELKRSMNLLAKDPKTVFIGYNTAQGSKANGTLTDIAESQLIETPVAENLMVGMAIGMSLRGYKPVIWLERYDFITCAMDAIVNHLDKIHKLSKTQYDPKVIIRVNIGGKNHPLYTGLTHTQDFTEAMKKFVSFPVISLDDVSHVYSIYRTVNSWPQSCIIAEKRDLYAQE